MHIDRRSNTGEQKCDTKGSRKQTTIQESALNLHTVRLCTEGDYTRGRDDTICPPEDEQRAARNMLRIVV